MGYNPNTPLKCVYRGYRMILKAYNTNSSNNTINKALVEYGEFDIRFKEQSSIINPIVILTSETTLNFNYAFIAEFNRYYFVQDITVFPNKIYQVSLQCDVLESFKNDILNSFGFVSRQNNYNPFYDSDYENEIRKEINVYKSNVTIDNTIKNNVLVTIGGV